MKFSVESTPRVYYLKGVFFLLVFVLIAFSNSVSHSWTTGNVAFVVLGFGLACLEFLWGFRLQNKTKQQ